jgi:hypothetical protein
MLSIRGLNKAELLAALYNNSKISGIGFYSQISIADEPGQETKLEEAQAHLDQVKKATGGEKIEFFLGKIIKMDFAKETINPSEYDQANGKGTASKVILQLRKSLKEGIKHAQQQEVLPSIDVLTSDAQLPRMRV